MERTDARGEKDRGWARRSREKGVVPDMQEEISNLRHRVHGPPLTEGSNKHSVHLKNLQQTAVGNSFPTIYRRYLSIRYKALGASPFPVIRVPIDNGGDNHGTLSLPSTSLQVQCSTETANGFRQTQPRVVSGPPPKPWLLGGVFFVVLSPYIHYPFPAALGSFVSCAGVVFFLRERKLCARFRGIRRNKRAQDRPRRGRNEARVSRQGVSPTLCGWIRRRLETWNKQCG